MKKVELSGDPWQWPDLEGEELTYLVAIGSGSPDDPLFKYLGVRQCNDARQSVEEGNGMAIMYCICICGTHGLVMPDWLARAFNARYLSVANFAIKRNSWDEAFGTPYPKETTIAAQRKRRTGRYAMHNAMCDAVMRGRSVSKELYGELGRKFGYGETLAYELYREAIDVLGLPDAIKDRRKRTAADLSVSRLYSEMRQAQESETGRIGFAEGVSLAVPQSPDGPARATTRRKSTSSGNSKKSASMKRRSKG